MGTRSGRPADRRPREETLSVPAARPTGATDGLDALVPRIYTELRRIAHLRLRAEPAGLTLSTTDVVHEAFIRLAGQARARWANRAQLLAVAARMMRRILVDHARRHRALRRGGGRHLVPYDDQAVGSVAAAQRADELIALDEALTRLAATDERLGRVVELRFFVNLTESEAAKVLGVTPRTVARDWVKARGWLYQELRPDVE
jgi:RNA polymerase sigma factor (TIGR02999 family)